ncbi:hypothetical protein DL96DRAFT_1638201 [Flagelloscypha sp. PMI_526]|nr:hypothetical protein DL96DRAFT_1638201 [Flagelloscypha sp. PMI_526]
MDAASQIPLELLEYIVNLIPSNAALQTCSVTCKALVPASQLRLFRTVTLRTEHQIHAFDTALTTNSNLTPYVFNLGLVDLDELVGVIQPTVSILSKVKGQLRTFSLLGDTVWGCTWGRLDDSIKKAIELLTKQPKFEGADCQFLGDSPVALASLSSVHHLELYYSIRVHYGVAISTPHRLKSLRISYCNVEGDVLAETPETVFSHDKSLLDFSGIERLVVDPTLHRLPGSSSTSSTPSETGPWISFVGKLCASSLVELYWELGSNDLQPPNLLLNDLPCLSSLNIGFSYEKEAPSCEQRCKLLSSWLGTRVPLLPMRPMKI